MSRIRVMQVVDSLAAGGAERVAINLANFLPRDEYVPYLCTTRKEGPLASLVAEDVGRLQLRRRQRFDIGAIGRLIDFIQAHNKGASCVALPTGRQSHQWSHCR